MLRELKSYFLQDKIVLFSVIAIVVLNAGIWIALRILLQNPEEFRVLRYSAYFGVTDFGPARELYNIPFIGSVIGLTNMILSYFLHAREKNLSRIIVAGTVFLQLLIVISLIAILLQKTPQ